jgi:hypothetical protein
MRIDWGLHKRCQQEEKKQLGDGEGKIRCANAVRPYDANIALGAGRPPHGVGMSCGDR